MPLCRLCHHDCQLRDSHIVPKFLHEGLYNTKGHAMAITGLDTRGWKPVQDGAKEYLFCEKCEQHFNKYYEEPFLDQWVKATPLPDPWGVEDLRLARFDYSSFKLFHLSVFFRASVSSLLAFATVALGPHEERLRQLILSRNPGEAWEYPILGRAIVHHETKHLIHMVSGAVQSSSEGHRCYGMLYGGVEWCIRVSSHRDKDFESDCLQPNGEMPFRAVPWNEIQVIQWAAEALRHPRRRGRISA